MSCGPSCLWTSSGPATGQIASGERPADRFDRRTPESGNHRDNWSERAKTPLRPVFVFAALRSGFRPPKRGTSGDGATLRTGQRYRPKPRRKLMNMHAIRIHKFGGPEVLEDDTRPQ